MNKEFRGVIEAIKDHYRINQGEIAARLGVTPQYLSTVIGGGAPFNDTLRNKIMDTFPETDLSEIGEDGYIPSVESAVKLYCKSNAMTLADLGERLGVSQQAVSGVLKRGFSAATAKKWADVLGFSAQFLMTGEGQLMVREEENTYHTVPLLPIFAQAGHLIDWSDGIMENECERVLSPVKDVTMAVTIYGESMTPELPSGSIAYVKRIDPNAFIEWGKIYILDTVNGALVKFLAPGHEEGYVKCVSANPDPIYAPFEVSSSDILGIYKVVMCMAMK